MIVKVCGMRDAGNIREVEQLSTELSVVSDQQSIDMMGFIFWPKSSRYVSERPAYLPTEVRRVGVFVDACLDEVVARVHDYALDAVQLHGKESPAYVARLRSACPSVLLLKALSVAGHDDIAAYRPYEGVVDYFLFDTKCKTVGGSGQQFDWTVLDAYDGTTPFLLSGGIGPDDAEHVKAFRHPRLAGIDLNSRFEVSPAFKDVNKLKQFLEQL